MNAADEISQAERRRIMADERRMKSYHGHALDDEPELSGRFAKVSTTTVVGRGPVNYPAQPEGSPWRSDPVPPEMPLGIDINAQEPTARNMKLKLQQWRHPLLRTAQQCRLSQCTGWTLLRLGRRQL